MPLTKEEIGQIAQAVAKEVVGVARGCRCGVAMWDAHGHTDSFQAVIDERMPDWLGPLPRIMEDIVANIEEACSVDMSKAKSYLEELKDAVRKGDWKSAERQLIELRIFIRGPVEECATKKEE